MFGRSQQQIKCHRVLRLFSIPGLCYKTFPAVSNLQICKLLETFFDVFEAIDNYTLIGEQLIRKGDFAFGKIVQTE